MLGFDNVILGGFLTYLVVKYVEATREASTLTSFEARLYNRIDDHMQIKAMNRELNRLEKDIEYAEEIEALNKQIQQAENTLNRLNYYGEEDAEQNEVEDASVNRRRTVHSGSPVQDSAVQSPRERMRPQGNRPTPVQRRPPVRTKNVAMEEMEEETGTKIHMY